MSKSTPGPWNLQRRSERTNNFGIYDASGTLMASIYVHQLSKPATIARHMADGRLMAHAPELLAALREIVEDITDASHLPGDWSEQVSVRNARIVIAKATGEQP